MFYKLFCRHADFKVKETKKQLADMQQSKKWMSDSISGWRIQHLIDQFDEMVIKNIKLFYFESNKHVFVCINNSLIYIDINFRLLQLQIIFLSYSIWLRYS